METASELHSVGPFILEKKLGEGATGFVKLAFHKDTGFKVAVKVIKKETLTLKKNLYDRVKREIAVLKLLDHPNVMKLYDVYETTNYLFLITEYIEGGELFDYIVSKGTLDSNEAHRLFQQLIHGVDYLHSHHICHRDLKPENILLDAQKNVKIADFGMATVMLSGACLKTSCGSPHYASPEVILGIHYDGHFSDTWSCGIILYALTSGKLPFDDDNIRVLLRKVKSGVYVMPPFLHKDIKDLISKLLVVDPDERYSVKDIKKHSYFLQNQHELRFPSIAVLQQQNEPLIGEVDNDIVNTLAALFTAPSEEIVDDLMRDNYSLCKSYYRVLEKVKQSSKASDRFKKLHIQTINSEDGKRRRSSSVAPMMKSEVKVLPPEPEEKISTNNEPEPIPPISGVLRLNERTEKEADGRSVRTPHATAEKALSPTPAIRKPRAIRETARSRDASRSPPGKDPNKPYVLPSTNSNSSTSADFFANDEKNFTSSRLRPVGRRASVNIGTSGAAITHGVAEDILPNTPESIALDHSPALIASPAVPSFWSSLFNDSRTSLTSITSSASQQNSPSPINHYIPSRRNSRSSRHNELNPKDLPQ